VYFRVSAEMELKRWRRVEAARESRVLGVERRKALLV
jgi:hypothetical protein